MRLLIREIRQSQNMTLKALGEKIGRKANSVWEYENHQTRIPASVLYDIAQALHVSIGDLCTDDAPPPPTATALPARSAASHPAGPLPPRRRRASRAPH